MTAASSTPATSNPIGRREFVGALLSIGAATALGSATTGAAPGRARLGFQLYTARRELARDFSGTLARIAAIGYDEVELAGYHGNPPSAVRSALRAAGLSAPSAHVGMPELDGDWPRTVANARSMGHEYLIFAWVPEAHRTPDGYKRLAARFNRAGEAALASGVRFGYHNYTYDFARVGDGFLYEVLLGATDPRYVTLQLDVYWLVDAGRDPLEYLARYAGRYTSLHLKDRAADGRMTDVGAGAIDWLRVIRAARDAGARHLFVEHDDPVDALASARTGLSHLRALRI